ncbi:MAG TPA: tetratricopeptide repeat protein, partial [Longimicrobium sp.]|uniref:tetratricopeptide repeat protein n=1 Tax=Longimicrobium sp. TaxID=2029185 RepID=UPI002EDBA66C
MADLSPELASRIQSLESSFADNPGRYFVALAGAWREAGEPGRAEEILREHLKRFPGLSPHVLLGRCLADRGAWQEASNEFHYVLSIDSQNLIALRTLAEMASAQGRRDEAQRWYNELLAVDPMNAEARQALAGLSRSGADAATLDQPVQVGREWGASGEADRVAGTASGAGFAAADEEFGLIDLNSAPPSAAAQSQAESAAGEWGEISLDAAAPSTPTAHTQPASGGDFDAFAFGSMSLDHGAADEPAAQGLDMPSFNAGPSLDLPALDAGSSLAAEGTGDWVNSDARQDLGESAAADLALPSFSGGMADAPVAGADLPLLDFSGQEDGDADGLMQLDGGLGFGDADASAPQGGAGDHHDHVDAEVVTETMAELYASQGLLARAAEVYRELIQQRGDEPGLVRRLAEIEGRISGQSAAADEDAAPAWLQGVDAFASGTAATTAPAFSADRFEETYQEETSFSTDFSASTPAPAADAAASGFAADLDLTAGLSDASGAAAAAAAPAASFPGSGDPFADSFAGGFDGIAAPAESSAAVEAPAGFAHVPTAEAPASAEVPAPVAGDAGDDRQAWSAPTVTETESEGFDLIVVADDGEEQHIHASAED